MTTETTRSDTDDKQSKRTILKKPKRFSQKQNPDGKRRPGQNAGQR
ncbi:MAG: hypothetical protein WKF71_17155 [Pyrinomonadaceae bacterium]